ncbi:MAG: hypothetical protein AAF184_12550 [Pseudomonadota bacterium]
MSAGGKRRYEHVFVLCTGRCGSLTFAHACEVSIDNYTSGHETRLAEAGAERLAFPAGHIEIDNRLSFFLGRLHERFGEAACYVHLQRDPAATARSYARRRALGFLLHAWTRGVYVGLEDAPDFEAMALDLVTTVNANIRLFLQGKPHQLAVHLENAAEDFGRFRERIGAAGSSALADEAWSRPLNASLATSAAAAVAVPADRPAIVPAFAPNAPLPEAVRAQMHERLDGQAAQVSATGREGSLEAQLQAIRADFAGASALCLAAAELVVHLRRGVDLEGSRGALFALTHHPETADFLARELSLRWLVSVLDSYADHAPGTEAAGAMALSVLVNTIKLAETERLIVSDPAHDDTRRAQLAARFPTPLFGGVNAFRLESGDMVRNLFARLETVLQDEPFLIAAFARVRRELRTQPNLLSRLATYHPALF